MPPASPSPRRGYKLGTILIWAVGLPLVLIAGLVSLVVFLDRLTESMPMTDADKVAQTCLGREGQPRGPNDFTTGQVTHIWKKAYC